MIRAILVALLICGPATADPVQNVIAAAERSFDRLPDVQTVDQIAGLCGADAGVDPHAAYCTSQNMIFRAEAGQTAEQDLYYVAHLFGHAVQVRHGIADIALRTISANRDRETELRRDVERMVDCLAGVILSVAGQQEYDLAQEFTVEPFARPHWGRDPLSNGPWVEVGLQERATWLAKGLSGGHPGVCDTENFPADLAVAAFRR